MPTVRLTAGSIDYIDSGGSGPTVVFLHGVSMDASVWRKVIAELEPNVRCVAPTLPLGSHRRAMDRPDLVTHRGVANLVGELLEALDLHDVTLVLNDWGGAVLLIAEGSADRVGSLALIACEAFDNFPPGRSGRALTACARLPGAFWVLMQLQRFRWFRRAPGGWGWMSKRPVPGEVMDRWFQPAQRSAAVRRDLRSFALSTPSSEELRALPDRLRAFGRPVLVGWASEDRLMPREHGPRLAEVFPRGRLVEIDDSYTLVPEDQPERLSEELRQFVAANATDAGRGDR